MTPTSRLIRAFRRFNADNIALWESLLSAQRPWESDPTHRGTGAPQDRGNAGTPEEPVRRHRDRTRWTLAR